MRVALLQIRLSPDSPSENVQSALSAIDRSAQQDPPPDLLVLPGACDTGGVPSGKGFPLAIVEAVREAIAGKAREWGVYIAAGLHAPAQDGELTPVTVLLDADGDVLLRVRRPTQSGDTPGTAGLRVCPTAIGHLGVLGGVEPSDAARLEERSTAGFIAVPMPASHGKESGESGRGGVDVDGLMDEADSKLRPYWGFVVPAASRKGGSVCARSASFVCGHDGAVVAAAGTDQEAIVYADVSVAPLSPKCPVSSDEKEGHAD